MRTALMDRLDIDGPPNNYLLAVLLALGIWAVIAFALWLGWPF